MVEINQRSICKHEDAADIFLFFSVSSLETTVIVKPVLSQKLVFKTDYRLIKVKSIAECSKRAFCSTLDLHQATIYL